MSVVVRGNYRVPPGMAYERFNRSGALVAGGQTVDNQPRTRGRIIPLGYNGVNNYVEPPRVKSATVMLGSVSGRGAAVYIRALGDFPYEIDGSSQLQPVVGVASVHDVGTSLRNSSDQMNFYSFLNVGGLYPDGVWDDGAVIEVVAETVERAWELAAEVTIPGIIDNREPNTILKITGVALEVVNVYPPFVP